MHGFGKAKDSDGKVLIGMWIDGHAHGKCRLKDHDTVRSVCYKTGTLVFEGEPEQGTQTDNPLSDGLNWLTNAIACNLGCEALGCGTRSAEMRVAKARPSHIVSGSEASARGRARSSSNEPPP